MGFYLKHVTAYPANPLTCAARIDVFKAKSPFREPGTEPFPGPSIIK